MTTENGNDAGAAGGDAGTDTGTPAAETPAAETPQTALGGADTGTDKNAGDAGDKPADTSKEPSGDNKAADKTGADGDGDSQNPETPTPTEYSDFTMPEGFEVNDEVMGEFKGLLTDVGTELGQPLSQESAQKFVDMGGRLVQEGVEMAVQHAADYHANRTQEWIDTFQKDPELGGTEEKQQQVLSDSKRVAQAIGGDALIKAIDETGAGNHPEIIRAFHKLKDYVGEDGKLVLANQGGGEQNLAQRLYPNQQT